MDISNHSSDKHTRNFRVTSHFLTRAESDFFNNRVIQYWNQLPSSVKHAPSVNAFKVSLDVLHVILISSTPLMGFGTFQKKFSVELVL